MSLALAPPPAGSPLVDTQPIFRKLRRRWKFVLFATSTIFGVLAVSIFSLTPQYYAQGTVMINEREAKVVAFQQVLSAMPADAEAVQSEVQVLTSRELSGRVVDELKLTELPEFNPDLDNGKLMWSAMRWLRTHINHLKGKTDKPISPALVRIRAVNILEKKLAVEPIGRSRALTISVRVTDPNLGADVVNGLIRFYIDSQLENKLKVTRRANSFLATQADDMRAQVREADAAVASYRTKVGLFQGTNNSLLVTQEITEATQQLAAIRVKKDEAEARSQEAEDPVRRWALPEVVTSQLIGRLQEQENMLTGQAIQAETMVGQQNVRAVQLRLAVKDAREKISQEVNKIVWSLRIESNVQKLREAMISAKVEQLKKELGQSYQAEVKMAALQREADVARGLLSTMLTRRQEVSVGEVLQQADATVLSSASVPLEPAFPNIPIFLAVAMVASTGLGCVAGLVLGRDGAGLKSMEEITLTLSVRALGLIPQLPRNTHAGQYVLEMPQSAFAESLRTILTTVIPPGSEHQILLVASAVPDEGKTSTAIGLARLAAKMGLRTVLIDADLRRPTLHYAVGCHNENGLTDVLEGRSAPMDVLKPDPASTLSIVTSGMQTIDTARLLSSSAMRQAMNEWRTEFDLVIVDSAPTASVADARIIARCCDEALFVVRWNRTHRGLVSAEIERMRETGVRISGLVLTQVNMRQHASYGFADPGFYNYEK